MRVRRRPLSVVGVFVTPEQLLMEAWEENADPFTRTVYVTIARLKRELGEPPLIQTSPGLGYKSPRLNDVRL